MAIRKFKSTSMSPIFEKLNLERLKRCSQTTESAKRLIDESKKLARESQELVDKLKSRKKRKTT